MEQSKRRRGSPCEQPPARPQPLDENSALNALIQNRGAQWSEHARAIKFDIEFKAIESEKRRVAKELHDEILPSLARLIRSVQSFADKHTVCLLVDELHQTVATFRDLLGELHAFDLEELGLVPALSNLCTRYKRLTGKMIVFNEESEECHLSDLQQLSIYRAMQTAFKIFSDSGNDFLHVSFSKTKNQSRISAQCVDKRVSSVEWLLGNHEFSTFESWCSLAGGELRLAGTCDFVLSVSDSCRRAEIVVPIIDDLSQARLSELDSIIALAKEEWTDLIKRDCALFRKLAVEMERKKILAELDRRVLPHFDRVADLAKSAKDARLRAEIRKRMQGIRAGVDAVLTELHASLLEKTGFVSSIRTVVDRFRHATMIDTTLISNLWSNQIDSIPLDTKFEIYRVAQEALNNIEKHSDATRALIIVTKHADELVVCIEDNGKGFRNREDLRSRGVKIIKERSAAIGATAEWSPSSSFETGTLVTISLPCIGLLLDNQRAPRAVATPQLG